MTSDANMEVPAGCDMPMSAEQQLDFERLLSDLSNAFAKAAADVDQTIDTWLQRVVGFLELDAGAISEFAPDGRSGRVRHCWMSPGLPPLPEYMTDTDWPWSFKQALEGKAVAFGSLADLPTEAQADARMFDQLGVKSCLAVPLNCGSTIVGTLALGTVRYHRTWPAPTTQRVRLVGEIVGAALARKHAQEGLQDALKEWQTTFDATNDAVMILDTEFRIIRANAATAWLLKLPLEQIVGSRCHALIHTMDAPIAGCPVEAAAATKRHAEHETQMGGAFYLVSADPVLGAYGEITGFVHTIRNITAHKRAEEELRSSEERFREMARSLPGVVYRFYARDNGQRGLYYVDARARDICGLNPDPLETWTERFLACVPPEEKEGWVASIREAVNAGKSWSYEGRFLKPDGQEVFIRGLSQPKRLNDEVVYTGILLDVTERKRAEVALAESRTLLSALVDSTTDMIWSVDPERFGLLTFNKGLQDYFHSRRGIDIHIGMTPEELLPPEYAVRWREFYCRALQNGAFVTEYETVAKTHALLLSLNLLKRDGEVFGISVFGKDITERMRSEQELSKAYQQIESLKDQLQAENVYLREELSAATGHGQIVGTSNAIGQVVTRARQVAPTDSSVLILGETGTGKELLAHFIHSNSRRSGKPFVIANLAAMPATLIEGELFGREKGAYTGALTRQIGRFEVADGGTIFLDEIGEMPMETQMKLLRVLQSSEFERLGSSRTIRVNVRVIAATNRDLVAAVRNGTFRQDLYYRLNVFPVLVPPLRERREDTPLLAQAFARELGERMGKMVDRIRRRDLEALQAYDWPGNIRELRNVIERSLILSQGPELRVELPEYDGSQEGPVLQLREVEKRHILQVLEQTGWRIRGAGGAAEKLGINPSTLHSRLKKLGIRRNG